MPQTKPNGGDTAAPQEFTLQRLYLKDCSFETPQTPQIFQAEWHPEVALELQTRTASLGEDAYEAILGVTVTAKIGEKVAFLAEVKQAGVFTIKGFSKEQVQEILGIACPGVLFPYIREAISNLISRGSFPQLLLEPINFEAVYKQQIAAAEVQESGTVTTH